MNFVSMVMLGIAANLDNLGIGLTYGLRKIKIPLLSNIVIAVLSGVATILSSFAGSTLLHILPCKLCSLLGGVVVSIVGVLTILSLRENVEKKTSNNIQITTQNLQIILKEPCRADADNSGHISIKEAILLGMALAVNCLATGLGAGMIGVNVLELTISIMFFSLLTIFSGGYIGRHYFSGFLEKRATLIAGVILIVIGVYKMFG